MRLHRFITEISWSDEKRIVVDEPRVVNQVFRVLRFAAGDSLIIVSPTEELLGVISEDSKKAILVIDIINRRPVPNHSVPMVHLYCAMLKKENFEWVTQKATEVGVASITPVLTSHTVKQGISLDRMRIIALEAAEQSGRFSPPKIGEIVSLADGLSHSSGLRCFADIGTEAKGSIGSIARVDEYALFIGPEGGWDEQEREMARLAGSSPVSLGAFTLRAETAAIVGVYSLVNR